MKLSVLANTLCQGACAKAAFPDSFYFIKVVSKSFPPECAESTLSELIFGRGFVYRKLELVDAYGYFVLSIFWSAPYWLDLCS